MAACVSTKPAETTSFFFASAMAVSTDDARHSGVADATSSKYAVAGVYVCGPSSGIASGFSGETFAISSALRRAVCRLASSNRAVVTVPERLPNRDVIARLTADVAPAVVTVLRAKRTLARSLPLMDTNVCSALLSASARSASVFACSFVQIMVTARC